VIAPALELTGRERAGNHISEENERLILDTTHQLIGELSNRFANARISPSVRVLGAMAPGDVNILSLLMLLELLRKDGVVASFAGENKSADEICDLVKRFTPDLVFISCMTAEGIAPAIELVRALRSGSARVTIAAVGPEALQPWDELLNAGCDRICGNVSEARRALRSFILQRAKSRLPFGAIAPRRYARENG